MKTEFEYIVLGVGGIGSGALYWLARRAGREVLGLEQFEIGHVRGGSQDHSRIIRLSYHTPGYVRLAQAAYAAWAELEADIGDKLIVKTGGLDLTFAGAGIPIGDYAASMTAVGVPFEQLSAAEVMYRWPQFSLSEQIFALYQAESGIAPAARCMAAHWQQAQAYGATVRDNVGTTAVTPIGDQLKVVAGRVAYRCRQLIITAGAWTNELLAHFGQKLPLTVTQEQVTYYNTPHAADFAPDRFPIWIWMDTPSFYGLPVYGEAGPKVAQDVGGDVVTAATRTFDPNPVTFARTEAFVRRYIPKLIGTPIYTKTCLYTMPPDRDFVLAPLPQQPNIFVAVGAGHAFKFSSLLGKILSELAIDGSTAHDISPFAINRPILLEENPSTHFMT